MEKVTLQGEEILTIVESLNLVPAEFWTPELLRLYQRLFTAYSEYCTKVVKSR
jgi:hypothetical protein